MGAHLSGFAARRRPSWFWQAQLGSPQQRTVSSGPQEPWPRAKKSAAPATCWVHESAFVSVLSHRITHTKGPSTPHPIAQFSAAQSRGWHSQKGVTPPPPVTHIHKTHIHLIPATMPKYSKAFKKSSQDPSGQSKRRQRTFFLIFTSYCPSPSSSAYPPLEFPLPSTSLPP